MRADGWSGSPMKREGAEVRRPSAARSFIWRAHIQGVGSRLEVMAADRGSEGRVPEGAHTEPFGATKRGAVLGAGIFLGYVLMAVAMCWGAWSSPSVRYVGAPGDPPFTMWMLRWTPYALSHGQNPFFTTHLNYPDGVNLMWNSLMFVPGMVLSPITLRFGPVVAYNTLVSVSLALSAWAGWFAMRALVKSNVAAFVGGGLFGFSPYMLAQARDHPSLTCGFVAPLVLLLVARIAVGEGGSLVRQGAILGVLAAVQFYTAQELLASEALVVGLLVVVLCVLKRHLVVPRLRYAVPAAVSGVVVFMCLVLPALNFQFSGPQQLHSPPQPANFFVTDVTNVVVPTHVQAISWIEHPKWTGNMSEWDGYLGVAAISIVALVAWRLRARLDVLVAVLVLVGVLVLSLGPHLHFNGRDTGVPLPWSLVDHVPLVNGMLPSRLMLHVDLLVALLAALLLEAAMVARGRAFGVASGLLIVALVATWFPRLPFPSTAPANPAFFRAAGSEVIPADSVVLIAPFQQLYPAEPMLWQAETGMRFRMPQGYFLVPGPDGKASYGAPLSAVSFAMLSIQAGTEVRVTPQLRTEVLGDLMARRVETVVVGPMPEQERMVSFFGDVFSNPGVDRDGVHYWRVSLVTR